MHITFGVAIVTYNGADRVAALLESMRPERGCIDQLLVSEDPCDYPFVHSRLLETCVAQSAELCTRPTWGCMQGNAIFAMDHMETDVVALLSDDVLVTPGCLLECRRFWEKWWNFPIGIAQVPYWGNWSDLKEMGLIADQQEFYLKWREYITQIPRNGFWDYDGSPRLYVNVHGCGFSVRRSLWYALGGPSEETWSYDEDIAARCWICSPNVVVTQPGPPIVHFGGASQCGREHPETDVHTLDAWKRAWGGLDKHQVHLAIRKRMAQRAYLDEEFRDTRGPIERCLE